MFEIDIPENSSTVQEVVAYTAATAMANWMTNNEIVNEGTFNDFLARDAKGIKGTGVEGMWMILLNLCKDLLSKPKDCTNILKAAIEKLDPYYDNKELTDKQLKPPTLALKQIVDVFLDREGEQ